MNDAVKLTGRLPVRILKELEKVFQSPVQGISSGEIARKAGVCARTVTQLKILQARRPDLLKEVFADRLSLHKAYQLYQQEPEKAKPGPLTRF